MIPPVDTSPAHLDIIRGVLERQLPAGTRVWAFGSRARWETADASDLDLAVDSHNPGGHKCMSARGAAFGDSNPPYAVDVVDLMAVSDGFRRIINGHKVLPMTTGPAPASGQWVKVRPGDFAPLLHERPLPAGKRNSIGSIPAVGSSGVIGFHDVGLTAGYAIIIGRNGDVGAIHCSRPVLAHRHRVLCDWF